MSYSYITNLIHYGKKMDSDYGAMSTPIYQTATFSSKTVSEFEKKCENWEYIYSRECNPNLSELEEKIAMLEKGKSALLTSSGMGAITSTILSLVKSGEHIICSSEVFSHTKIFIEEISKKFMIDITFVDIKELYSLEGIIKENTKIVYLETPTNPTLNLIDIRKVAKILKDKNILLIVDSTFATPILQQPLTLGADIVVHSLTKFMNGSGDALGGVIVSNRELIEKIRWPGLCCLTGASMTPLNAWLINRGIKTLDMRMERHCKNALKLAEYLESNEFIEYINYPSLKTNPNYDLCKRQMKGLGGGIVSFKLKKNEKYSSYDLGTKVLNNLKLASIATSLGEESTLVQIYKDGLIRVSVGLEFYEDIIEDFKESIRIVYGERNENRAK